MTDLFSLNAPPAPTKIGQANGEFLARLAMMSAGQRKRVKPSDFPHANPNLVTDNVRFHGG